ncbi:MAG TPA: efflux transporter periplasmic adaptor subunit [Gammaproteobacteria bacterium]|nr:efflux transporter periplasmic adaptor subunit [Gammaproteobacteria bacterium]|tara:strand:- start:357 stop:1496 length:1140 start_codon:yes stop_codon:yes gene_type:complete
MKARFLNPLTLVLVVVVIAVLVTVVPGSADEEGNSGNEPSAATALTVSLVEPKNVVWPEIIKASGAIAAWQEAKISAEISGAALTEVLVDVGDNVQSGDILARFDSAPARAQLAQQRALLDEAKAHLAEAKGAAKRAQQLDARDALSEQESIRAKTKEQAARAQVQLAQARLDAQQLSLDKTQVVAPDSGVITARNATLGAVGTPGAELFRLLRQNRLEWHPELTAESLVNVSPSDTAEIQLPRGMLLTGKVRQIAPMLDAGTRTGIVFVALDAATTNHARAGMFASGTINVGERPALALPTSSIVHRDGYEYIFLVDREGGRTTEQKVTTGRRFSEWIEIIEGVTPGTYVVRSGGAFLTDGDQVKIVDWPMNDLGGAE